MFKWTDGTDYLMHYGIKGQRWGIRRFQNEDGSLTAAGKERYASKERYGTKWKRNELLVRKHALDKPNPLDKGAESLNSPWPYSVSTGTVNVKPFDLQAYRYDNDSKFNQIGKKDPKREQTHAKAKQIVLASAKSYAGTNNPLVTGMMDEHQDYIWKNMMNPEWQDEILQAMSKKEYTEYMKKLDALYRVKKDHEYDFVRGDKDLGDAIIEEADAMIKKLEREVDAKIAQSKLHKEKKQKGVDQKVEMN